MGACGRVIDSGAIGKGAGNIVVRGEAVIGCLHVVRF